jgi:hypothetical protein
LLGDQRHLTFVGDFDGHIAPEELRSLVLLRAGLYPHLVDLEPVHGLPRGDVSSTDPSPPQASR